MKPVYVLIIVSIALVLPDLAGAALLTTEEMGYMELTDYGYFVAILGVMSGVAFVWGMKI